MRKRTSVLLGLLVSGLSCVQGSQGAARVGLQLTGPAEVSLDQESSGWSASLVNEGSDVTDLVLPGDGSESGMRTPLVGWSVIPAAERREHPRETPRSTGARCGNINTISSAAVASVPPAESVPLGPWIGQPMFPGPGTYRVILYYENQPDLPVTGIPLGKHDASALRRIQRTVPLVVRSNEVTVVVRS